MVPFLILLDSSSIIARAPHPQPLSPEYQGEGSQKSTEFESYLPLNDSSNTAEQPVEKGVWNFTNHTESSVFSTFGEF